MFGYARKQEFPEKTARTISLGIYGTNYSQPNNCSAKKGDRKGRVRLSREREREIGREGGRERVIEVAVEIELV
jgi:hypothetical protein